MRLFSTVVGLQCYLDEIRAGLRPIVLSAEGRGAAQLGLRPVVGFVPTMGALHAGHLSLIQRARPECDVVVVSIFVNPMQFGPGEDFEQYPRPLEQDQRLCEQMGVDVIFAPAATEIYGNVSMEAEHYTHVVPPTSMTASLCGRSRPGHFQGVATVVTKLLNLVQPDRAYFGQKDAQQLAIIRRLVMDLNLPVKVVACPIVREPSGLAYSSRNQYLTESQRAEAAVLHRSLRRAKESFQSGEYQAQALVDQVKAELETIPHLQLDYVELVDPETLQPLETIEEAGLLAIAAYVGSTRLIDNMVLLNRKPVVAIDGPAGAGKSTVARRVAHELDLLYLDTGAMYRAVTWLALQSDVELEDQPAIAELVSRCQIRLQPGEMTAEQSFPPSRVWIGRKEVTQAIRSSEVTSQVSAIAAQPAVRRELVKQQQAYGRHGGVVMEGRDIGTHVFPDAELKIFLTASVQERARRRQQDLKEQNQPLINLEELERLIYERDRKDSTRVTAPLQKAHDAIEIQTDHLTLEEVVQKITTLYHQLPHTVS